MSNETNPQNQGQKGKQKKIAIEVPANLDANYANLAFITHTPAEIVIDFAQYLPRMPKGRIVSRILMSPVHAKLLHAALAQNLSNYERQFGEIRLQQRTSLADELFRFRAGEEDDNNDEDDDKE